MIQGKKIKICGLVPEVSQHLAFGPGNMLENISNILCTVMITYFLLLFTFYHTEAVCCQVCDEQTHKDASLYGTVHKSCQLSHMACVCAVHLSPSSTTLMGLLLLCSPPHLVCTGAQPGSLTHATSYLLLYDCRHALLTQGIIF